MLIITPCVALNIYVYLCCIAQYAITITNSGLDRHINALFKNNIWACTAISSGAADHVPMVAPAEDAADISLISNKLVSLGQRSAVDTAEESSAIVLRSDAMALTPVGAETAGERCCREMRGENR